MHQIRVHLAAIDLPVVGDPVYGVPRPGARAPVPPRHGAAFPHPFTGERVEARSELPPIWRRTSQPLG